jgi:N-acetylglutamate synthase-like GNAT family acetyltransferase
MKPPSPPLPSLDIRPFASEHHAEVVDLVTTIQTKEFAIPITLAEQPDLLDVPAFYRRGAGEFWVACDGARVAGTIGLVDGGDGTASLRKMFVRAEYRGAARGVARSLLDVLLAHARAHGIRTIYLGTTAPMAAAHRFYEKSGFTEITRDAMPAAASFTKVDVKFYRRDLM